MEKNTEILFLTFFFYTFLFDSHPSCLENKTKRSESARVRYRLERNDPDFTCLRISGEFCSSDFSTLWSAMQSNQIVEKVDISGKFVATLSSSEKHLMWQAISRFPKLRVLSFRDFLPEFPLEVGALVDILEQQRHLLARRDILYSEGIMELDFSNVKLAGSLEDLSDSLSKQLSLKQIQSWELQILDDRKPQLKALKMLLTLRQVETLSYGNLNITHEQILAISNALQVQNDNNMRLKALRLRGGDGRADNGGPRCLTEESCKALAGMLAANSSLEKLELCEFEIPSTVIFYQALRHNSTCKSFHLFNISFLHRHDMTSDEAEALVRLLQSNHTLESVLPGDDHPEVDLYLRLNRASLRGIMVDVNYWRHKFWDLLATQTHDLDCVYHLLIANPSALSQPYSRSS